jgi:competence protein ComEA
MDQRTLLIAGIVAAAAVTAGWRNLAPQAPAVFSTPNSLGAQAARSVDPAPARSAAAAAPQESAARVVVYVAGEVRHPGVYTLPASARAEAAVAAAGGSTAAADLVAVNLAEHLTDGEAFVVPPKGVAAAPRSPGVRGRSRGGVAGGASRTARSSRGRGHKAPPASPIDINAAGAAELESLPGIGPSLAERIVAFREQNGRFMRIDDLLDVAGMSEHKLEGIDPYVVLR